MAKVRYAALANIRYDDRLIEVGGELELDEREAEQLLAAGHIEPVAAKPKAAKARKKPAPADQA